MSITLSTFKWLWVARRRRKLDENVAVIGVCSTKKECRKIIHQMKEGLGHTKGNKYIVNRELFKAKYER